MMKYFKTSLNLLLSSSLLLSSAEIFSAEKRNPSSYTPKVAAATTENSYGAFCSNGAGLLLKKLSDTNKSKIEQLEGLRAKLSDLEQTNSIIVEVSDLKNKYEKGLKEIADSARDKDAAKKALETANIDSMKSIIRNGMTLNALALLLKDENLASADTKMSSICAKADNQSQPICKRKDPANPAEKAYFTTTYFGLGSEVHKLDKTLEAFKAAHNRLSTPEQQKILRDEVSKIITSIPKDIAPSAILKILEDKSPQTLKLLSSSFPREKLMGCLDEKTSPESIEACKGILEDPKHRQELISIVGKESSAFGDSLAKSLAPVIDTAASSQKVDLTDAIGKILTDAKATDPADQLVIQTSQKVQGLKSQLQEYNAKSKEKKLLGLAPLFYMPPSTSGLDYVDISKVQKKAEADANEKALQFDRQCNFSKSTDVPAAQIKECKNLLDAALPKIALMQKNHAEEVYKVQNEIKAIGASDNFSAVESLKKFVVERYRRTCSDDKKVKVSDQSLKISMGCSNEATPLQALSQVEGLGNEVLKIAESINPIADSPEFAFSKAELESFRGSCSNLSSAERKNLSEVCGVVDTDKAARAKKKDTREWEEFNDKYWVNYDETSPTGYRKIEKKSTMRIIGEGVLPVAPSLIPMWFGNYQMKNNIEMLTNQAIYQKQMLHTISVYNNSPWMYSYNYFGFMPYSMTGTTGTTTTNPGFNFGQ